MRAACGRGSRSRTAGALCPQRDDCFGIGQRQRAAETELRGWKPSLRGARARSLQRGGFEHNEQLWGRRPGDAQQAARKPLAVEACTSAAAGSGRRSHVSRRRAGAPGSDHRSALRRRAHHDQFRPRASSRSSRSGRRPELVLTGPPDAAVGLLAGHMDPDEAKARGLAITGDVRLLRRLRPGRLGKKAPPPLTRTGGGRKR